MKRYTNNIARTQTEMASIALSLGVVLAASPVNALPAIEEITVTAEKRVTNLQETPIAITAFGSATLQKAGITNVQEIGRFVPNVKMDLNRGGSQSGGPVFIRGVGQSDPLPGADPGVGVYVDGVYLGRSTGSMFDLMDVERVEVLRGPQGTLFGKNTIGGAINIITTQPGEEFEGKAEFEIGNYDLFDARLSLNVPITEDKLFVRLNAVKMVRDGYTTNATDNGRSVDDKDLLAGRLAIKAIVSDDVDVFLTIDGTKSRNGMVPGRQVQEGAVIAQGSPDPYLGNYNLDGLANFDSYSITGQLNWDLGWSTFKSITGYRDMDDLAVIDLDGSSAPILEQKRAALEQWQFSQEFQLTGQSGDGRLNWFSGLYFFQEEGQYDEFDEVFGGIVTLDLAVGTDNKSYAAYGQASYDLTEKLTITAGLRYTYEKKRLNIRFGAFGPEMSGESWDSITPKFVLDYSVSDENNLYASISKGFKSGQLNARARSVPELQPLDPEIVWSYELGSKNRFLDNRFQLNLAAFYTDYSNIQVQQFVAAPNEIGFNQSNAGKAHLYGLEAEAMVIPIEGLTLSGTLGLLHDSYDEYVDISGNDLSDRRFENAPRTNFTLAAEYEYALRDHGRMNFRLDYSYQSKVFFEISNNPALSEDGYGLLSGKVSYFSPDEALRVSVYGKNLTKEEYLINGLNVVSLLGAGLGYFGPPRTYGLELGYSF